MYRHITPHTHTHKHTHNTHTKHTHTHTPPAAAAAAAGVHLAKRIHAGAQRNCGASSQNDIAVHAEFVGGGGGSTGNIYLGSFGGVGGEAIYLLYFIVYIQ